MWGTAVDAKRSNHSDQLPGLNLAILRASPMALIPVEELGRASVG